MARRSVLLAFIALALASGCSYKHLYGEAFHGIDLYAQKRVHVVQHAKDKRNIDNMIAERLRRAGFQPSTGRQGDPVPPGVVVVVSYEDHWMWDMSNYLLVLRIDFRDPSTNELVASGQSYRTSLDRKPPEFMVDEIITAILRGQQA